MTDFPSCSMAKNPKIELPLRNDFGILCDPKIAPQKTADTVCFTLPFSECFMFQFTKEKTLRFRFGPLNEDAEKQDHSISNIDIYQGAKITRMSVSLTAPSAVVSRASRYIRWGPGWVPSGSRPVQMCGEGALRWGERRAYFDCR